MILGRPTSHQHLEWIATLALLNQEKILNHAKYLIGQAPNFFLESHCPDYPKNAIALCSARRRNHSANISKIWLIQQGRTVHPQHSKFAKKKWRSSMQNVLTVHWPFDWCVFWQSKASSSHPRHHRFPARSRRSIKAVQLESNANIHISTTIMVTWLLSLLTKSKEAHNSINDCMKSWCKWSPRPSYHGIIINLYNHCVIP